MNKKLPKHLGGHGNKTHTDLGAIKYIKNKFNIKTAIDVGCGPGDMVNEMNTLGIKSIGIDGDFTLNRDIECIIHDFTKGEVDIKKRFDIAWSVEFLEHIEEKYLKNVFDVFKKCKYVICTYMPLGPNCFNGHHHVNCKNHSYWEKQFNENGFNYEENISKEIKIKSTMEREFMRNTGSFFINEDF